MCLKIYYQKVLFSYSLSIHFYHLLLAITDTFFYLINFIGCLLDIELMGAFYFFIEIIVLLRLYLFFSLEIDVYLLIENESLKILLLMNKCWLDSWRIILKVLLLLEIFFLLLFLLFYFLFFSFDKVKELHEMFSNSYHFWYYLEMKYLKQFEFMDLIY
jgi:hypothetical protein